MEFICLRCGRIKQSEEAVLAELDGEVCRECAVASQNEVASISFNVSHEDDCDQKNSGLPLCLCAKRQINALQAQITKMEMEFREIILKFSKPTERRNEKMETEPPEAA